MSKRTYLDALQELRTEPLEQDNKRVLKLVNEVCQLYKNEFGQPFSHWKPDDVYSFLGISRNVEYIHPTFQAIEPDNFDDLLQTAAKSVCLDWRKLLNSFGSPLFGKEALKTKFIDTIIFELLDVLQIKTLFVDIESTLESPHAWSFVEYVFKMNGLVCLIIEAKKDDLQKGTCQLMMELFAASSKENTLLRGFVTTLESWMLITRHEDATFTFSPLYFLPLDGDPSALKILMRIIALCLLEKKK
eukprot:Pompholyxophrys_punicea_v1_NODE_395_length_2063_cov_5.624004.p1 type:complete len:245 gc:universal NODE_395_length_2063_cov_5.624004:1173-1907(+)